MPDFLQSLPADSEMANLVRQFDWASTPMGDPESWSPALRMVVRFIMASRFPQLLFWGPEYTQIYNDTYAPILGQRHPEQALGKRFSETWAEVFHLLQPLVDVPFNGGPAWWQDDIELILTRRGYPEECHFMFAYSPVPDDTAPRGVGGVICTVQEITENVITERRFKVLSELAARVAEAKSDSEACIQALDILAKHPKDIPFALIYLFDENKRTLSLVGTTGVPMVSTGPAQVQLDQPSADLCWPLERALLSEGPVVLNNLCDHLAAVPAGPWETAPDSAVIMQIPSNMAGHPAGVLVVGLSCCLHFDSRYKEFLNLLVAPVATAIANARVYEAERRRAEALAEIDRAKTTFFSNISHEFRTPLGLMLGPLEEVMRGSDLPASSHKKVEMAHRNALRLLKLVNSLLDFARVEAGRIEAWFAPVDLAALTAEISSSFRSTIERAGLVFEVDCEDLEEEVYVDRDMWEKIVLNLLSNAFKFTMQGRIRVRVRRSHEHAMLEVFDTGLGVAPDEVSRMFERFYRIEGAVARTHEGSGIGLSLVQELVRMNGGRVSVKSQLNEGTCITVCLPFGTAHIPPDRIDARTVPRVSAEAQVYVQEALHWSPLEHDEAAELPMMEGADRQADRRFASTFGSRVLLADDNADMRDYVRALLAPCYVVEAVGDGRLALEAAYRNRPDLVLCDVMMPGLDGFKLLQAMRSDSQLKEIPIILVSARAGEESRVEGLEAGADDYIVKPFHSRELLARVGAMLELVSLRRESAQRFRAYVQASSDIVFRMSADWNEVTLLKYGELGTPPHSGHSWLSHYVYEDDKPRVRQLIEEATAAKRVVELEHRVARTDGSIGWVSSRAIPIYSDNGELIEWFGTATDITSRHRTEVELALQRKQLEQADRQKNEFLAMLAHELRNPLAPIRNASALLGHILVDNPKAQDIVEVVQRQVTHLTHLVDDLLDISRITQGRIELRNEVIELAEIVRQAVETVEPMITQRNLDLQIQASYRTLYISGDVSRLVQILVNLLTNAAKYTEPGGNIRVVSREQDGSAIIEVSDNGVGVPPELLPSLFDLFVQSERTLARSQGGLGIGLSVVKRLVEMHGGEVWAASEGPGRGATFSIRLPLTKAPLYLVEDNALPQFVARRILVVDDNVDAAETLSMLLSLEGHETQTAYCGYDALAQLKNFGPDLVLLDIGLPDIDGYEVARRIAGEPTAAAVRIVALTGYGQPEDKARALADGFHAHLVKPVDPKELRRVLQTNAAPLVC